MGRVIELIKSFINPKEEEKSFDELALDAGLSKEDIAVLKETMQGVNWAKYARSDDTVQKEKNRKLVKGRSGSSNEMQEQEISNDGEER